MGFIVGARRNLTTRHTMWTKLVFEWKNRGTKWSARNASHTHTHSNTTTHTLSVNVRMWERWAQCKRIKSTSRTPVAHCTRIGTKKINAKRHGSTDGPNRTDRRSRNTQKSQSAKVPRHTWISIGFIFITLLSMGAVACIHSMRFVDDRLCREWNGKSWTPQLRFFLSCFRCCCCRWLSSSFRWRRLYCYLVMLFMRWSASAGAAIRFNRRRVLFSFHQRFRFGFLRILLFISLYLYSLSNYT